MAETIISFVLDQLSEFLRQEGTLLRDLKQEVQLISDELRQMRAFLGVAEAKEEDDPRLHEWMRQVREAAYDIEDVLDEFMFLTARHHANGIFLWFRRISNWIKKLKARRRIANEIKSIKARIINAYEAHLRYRSVYGTLHHLLGSAPITNAWWDDALLSGKAKLVGIQKPKEELISLLLDANPRVKVISVLGRQGQGKTTLLQKVHEDARKQFQINAWVNVSQTRSIKELLQNLIRQICEQIKRPIANVVESIPSIDKLKSFVRDLLQGKRYGIVFDDVCDMDLWNSIKSALPESNNGSRVMLTTQVPGVAHASVSESQGNVYTMKPLSLEDSWTLFCNKTFKDGCCPSYLQNVVRDILNECGGLPLAIVAISGILALKDKNKADEWEMVREGLRGQEGTGKLEIVERILHLSYKELPSHLKTCLLYISIFPEDYEIQCHRLIQLWIAERFVQGRRGMTTEEVAFDYLKELIRRSLVRVTEVSWDGSPNHCRVHDLVREIILCKSQEQNMVTIPSEQHTSGSDKVHRLVINNHFPDIQRKSYFNHVRSLITFGSLESQFKTLQSVLSSSKLLKVLDISDAQLEEIPDEVFNLFHLKYLCLRGTRVKKVPKSIKRLQNLEHLHLGQTEVKELTLEILVLLKLRHLRVFQVVDSSDKCYGFKAPTEVGKLLFLHSLLYIDADETTIVRELGKLVQLRELGITKLRREDGKELCSSLQKLINLRELDVTATTRDEVIDMDHPLSSSSLQLLRGLILRGQIEKFPQWINSLQSLMKIDLIWSRLRDDDPLESLQHLPNLVEVRLSQAYEREELCFNAGKFLKLETLNLGNMQALKRVIVEKGAMPHLRRLLMSELPQLEELPWGIEHLREVKSLRLSDMSSELTEKLQNPNDATGVKRRIAQIPEVLIGFWTGQEWTEYRQ